MTERAVSDVVGYVLIISLILTSVGIVYTTGVTTLQDTRDTQRVSNAEQAFAVLQSNTNDVRYRGAPSRMTEIRLSNARLGPGDPVSITVSGDGTTSTNVTPVVYTSEGGTKIVYAHGAVIRVEPDGGAAMLEEPDFAFGERSLVPVVDTGFGDPTTVGGQTRVFVRVAAAATTDRSTQIHDVGGSANLTLTTPRPAPWQRYFTANERVSDCKRTGLDDDRTELTCTVETESVVVSETNVNVAFR